MATQAALTSLSSSAGRTVISGPESDELASVPVEGGNVVNRDPVPRYFVVCLTQYCAEIFIQSSANQEGNTVSSSSDLPASVSGSAALRHLNAVCRGLAGCLCCNCAVLVAPPAGLRRRIREKLELPCSMH